MALIKFTRNYNDKSTNTGFQFEFICDRCGNGYESTFQNSATGILSEGLDTAANLLGGIFGGAARLGESVNSAAWHQQKDAAFAKAIEEVKPYFKQCKRCGKWVDDTCWNAQRGLCLDDAPDVAAEMSAIQSEAMFNDARQKAATVDYVSADQFKQTIVATCPHCGEPAGTGKFCANCGKPLAAEKFCANCGKPIKAGAKFCPECGHPQ